MTMENPAEEAEAEAAGGNGKKEKRIFPQVEGKVQMTREGYAFIIAEGEEDDVFVRASKCAEP